MDDPSPAEEANLIKDFDGLAIPLLDHTFYAQHITKTYQENIDDFPRNFKNVDFLTNDFIFDASLDYTFPNPTNDDAFQNRNYLSDCLESEPSLSFGQMDLNNFDQPKSQLMVNFDDASGIFKSTLGDFLGKLRVPNRSKWTLIALINLGIN